MPLDRDIAAGYTGRPTGRPTGRTLAGTIGRTVGGEPRLGETGRSLGPAGGPTTLRNTYPQTAGRFDRYLQRGLNPVQDERMPMPLVSKDRMAKDFEGIGSLGEGFYTRDGEFVEAPLGGFEDRLDSLLGDILSPTTYEGFSPYYPDNLDVRYPGDFEASGQAPYGDQSAVDPSDWRVIQQILGAGGNPDDYIQSAGIMGALPQEENLMQQAKVYTNQDPGMIDEGYFWDDISPEAKAINKAYDYLRSKKPIYGSDPQGLRNAIENQLFEDERMYRNMLPESIRRDLPEDAFENLDDFRNQQRIILT